MRIPNHPLNPWLLIAALLLSLTGGCERAPPQGERDTDSSSAQSTPAPATTAPRNDPFSRPPVSPGQADVPVILFLGDSLAAGFGLQPERSFPALIGGRLRGEGYPHRVVNASVSGDTSAGGLARLDWVFRQRIDVMVLELGGNDGLRGQPPEAMRANLAAIIERAQAKGIRVVLAGMQMPDNYGKDYTRRYRAVFPELARKYGVTLIPFLLDGLAFRPEYNQPDGIHPNAEGARIVADNVWKVLGPMLEK